MLYEGFYVENVFNHDESKAYPICPQEMSGLTPSSQAIYKYSLKDSDFPNIIIPDPLFDYMGNIIMPGYYELALSDDRTRLLFFQSKELIATISVIKVEEDATDYDRLNDKDYKKQLKKEAKEREKVNKKRAKAGMPPEEIQTYMEASIEYIEDGDYYLIRYENGIIKAWGVFQA